MPVRKRKDPSRVRQDRLEVKSLEVHSLKCTPEEWQVWQATAKARGLTMNAWMREQASQGTPSIG